MPLKKPKPLSNQKKKDLNKSQLKLIVFILIIFLSIIIIGLIIWKWRVRQRFRKEAQFRRLKELELTAIRSQMNPHFLFNSLNSVQYLIQENRGKEANQYLANFAGLIRKVLKNSEKEEVSLADELEMTAQYLSLENLRFEFESEIKVDEEINTFSTQVPSMLLQPFVENAVIHGLQNKEGNKSLKIEVSRKEGNIKIIIEDNGIGRAAAKKLENKKNGNGTKRMKERLAILEEKYKEKYQLNIIDLAGENTGTIVEILIPEEI